MLDENMPESVRLALRRLGHEADSVVSLRLQGLDNGRLYSEVARDRGFADMVRALEPVGRVKVLRALKEFASAVRELYGSRLHGVVLYGSRARGDAQPDSDVDVLVVLRELGDSWEEAGRMSPAATQASLNHNVLLTVLPADAREFKESEKALFANIRREGVPVG